VNRPGQAEYQGRWGTALKHLGHRLHHALNQVEATLQRQLYLGTLRRLKRPPAQFVERTARGKQRRCITSRPRKDTTEPLMDIPEKAIEVRMVAGQRRAIAIRAI